MLVAVVALVVVSCGAKKDEATEAVAAEEQLEWKELDAYHMLMAEAFHPYKDSANLAPAKTGAAALAEEATKWVAAPLPAKVDNQEVKDALVKLEADSRAFAEKVAGGATDEELGASLNALHDHFHKIQEAWHHGGHHGHGENH